MRNDYCDITVVLDRSGSMSSIQKDTIGGFNTFLDVQRKLPGKATMTLVQFDDRYEPNYEGVDVHAAKPLTEDTYIPRGSTALLDAVGKTMVLTGERLKAMAESERPGKVIFAVITDGYENASREYEKQQVKDMTETQTHIYKWEFVYLGANVDAFAEGTNLGMMGANSMGYTSTPDSVQAAYSSFTANTMKLRAGTAKTMAWTTEDRKKQAESTGK
jgi:hypothetical protein